MTWGIGHHHLFLEKIPAKNFDRGIKRKSSGKISQNVVVPAWKPQRSQNGSTNAPEMSLA